MVVDYIFNYISPEKNVVRGSLHVHSNNCYLINQQKLLTLIYSSNGIWSELVLSGSTLHQAGNGIASSPENILDVLRQYRGLSWRCVLENYTTAQQHIQCCYKKSYKSAATVNCLTVNHVFFSVGGDGNLTTVTTLPSESPSSQRHLHHSHITPSKLSILFIFFPPDLIKYFNPNVTGFSVGMGKQNSENAFLNQAVAGAKTK